MSEKKSSIQIDKELNDIFSSLDEIKNNNDISIEKIREQVNNTKSAKIGDKLENYSKTVKVPTLPLSVVDYDSYSDCLFSFIKGVDYGSDNSREYVEGHKNALERYYKEISNNHKDLYLVEARINEEINAIESKDSLYDKGYYDGLFYVLRSIKKAKEMLTNKVSKKLKEKLS